MKIIVIADVHANLPALAAALREIQSQGYDALYHLGDVITIGPYPAECLELLLTLPNGQCIMGNHDQWFVEGLPQPQPTWMSDGEVAHQHWTHARLNPQLKAVVAQWPYVIEATLEDVPTPFLHYGLRASGRDFASIIKEPTVVDLDRLFSRHPADLIFYGHTHRFVDLQGRARYLNPGSLGCHSQAVARYTVVDFQHGQYRLEHRTVPYDISLFCAEFVRRQVPEWEFIDRVFFGGLLSQ